MHLYTLTGLHFADTYGAGAFGACPYSASTSTCAATHSGNSALVNTGIAVGLVVGLACLALVVAMLVRFWRRPAQRVAEAVDETDGAQQNDEKHPEHSA